MLHGISIGKLFYLVIEKGKWDKDAALIIGINLRAAQYYIKKYNDDDEKRLLIRCSKPAAGGKSRLTVEHAGFLVEYIDGHAAAVLFDIKHHLWKLLHFLTHPQMWWMY